MAMLPVLLLEGMCVIFQPLILMENASKWMFYLQYIHASVMLKLIIAGYSMITCLSFCPFLYIQYHSNSCAFPNCVNYPGKKYMACAPISFHITRMYEGGLR